MPVMLGGPYGLRMSEILGLRWQNVDLEKGVFHVVEQLPYKLPVGTKRSCRSNSLKRKRSKAARRMSW